MSNHWINALAARINAGEDVDAALADYGLVYVKTEAQLAEITQFSTFIRNRWDTSIHTVERQAAEIKRLTDALEEIAKKEGPYKIDPHEFACAVIESMAGIAKAALKEQDKE